jgi:hypothetical protein
MAMVFRLGTSNGASAPTGAVPRARPRVRVRTRRLAFEMFEPRLPLAAVPGLLPTLDLPATDAPSWTEVADSVCEATSAAAICESEASDGAAPREEEANSDARPPIIGPLRDDTGNSSDGDSLAIAPEPVSSFATLAGSPNGFVVEDNRGATHSSTGSPDDSASLDRRDPGPLPPVFDLGATRRDAEGERRQWTDAVTMRYPLVWSVPPGQGSAAAFPPRAAASGAGFLDVGRVVTSATGRLAPVSASQILTDSAPSGESAASLAMELESEGVLHARGASKPLADATSRRPLLAGENRSQRLVLLASARSRLQNREAAATVLLRDPRTETPATPIPVDGRSGDGGDRPGGADTRRSDLGILQRLSRPTEPSADDRVSRSTMEGIAAFFFLAAGWFRRRPSAASCQSSLLETQGRC